MKKRAKPRGAWDSVVGVPPGIFKKEDYLAISERLKIPLTEEVVKQLIDAQKYYYAGIRIINEGPRMSEICAMMRMLIRESKKWVKTLEKVDDRSLEKLQAACPMNGEKEIFTDLKNDRLLIWDRIEKALYDAKIIRGCAERALSIWDTHKAQKNTGAPFDFPFNSYICQLNNIFSEAKGKSYKVTYDPSVGAEKDYGEYTGPFLEFAWVCFNLIPGHPRLTKYAFGTRVRRALQSPIKFYSA
jgi:hypothetical protein